jgi:hypothetical protein
MSQNNKECSLCCVAALCVAGLVVDVYTAIDGITRAYVNRPVRRYKIFPLPLLISRRVRGVCPRALRDI